MLEDWKRKKKYMQFAYDCFIQYSRNSELTMKFGNDFHQGSEEAVLYQTAKRALDPIFKREIFDECLAKYGLRYKDHRHYETGGTSRLFELTLEKTH